MIGLDTNVLVRYFTQDDDAQTPRATALIDGLHEHHRAFVSLVVLVELHWVLSRAFRVSGEEAVMIVEELLDASSFVVQDSDLVRRALRQAASGADLADAVISELGSAAGCTSTVTFDRKATRHAGMTLL